VDMYLTFRWFGDGDPVTLEQIRQIPGVEGVVAALYDLPVGAVWPLEKITALKDKINRYGLRFDVIESVPVHEDIKLGLKTRERYIDNYCATLLNLGTAGIKVVCYNFMPVFDWTRTELHHVLADGSTALSYDHAVAQKMDPLYGDLSLPGWEVSYAREELQELIARYHELSEEELWANLEYFLRRVVPAAERAGIRLAIHPDDPPWPVFGIPRIIRDKTGLDRLINLVDSPANGITLCSGSLGANPENNIPELIRYFGRKGRIHFAHCRNIKITKDRCFVETAHPSADGSLDMVEIMKAYRDTDFQGPVRPDHGRMIWGEKGRPGYGLYDRALGAAYLNGIRETLRKVKN